MIDYTPPGGASTHITIGPWSPESLYVELERQALTGISVAAWPAANRVIYIPFRLAGPITITKLWWENGAVAGNVDAGVYDEVGALLVSTGTTAVAGANTIQVVDVTDTTIGRGTYYLAMVADTITTLTIARVAPAAGLCQSLGLLQQAGVTLPLATNASPATFAKCETAFIPVVGLQASRVVGP